MADTDVDSEQALANLAGRVRARHCEPGGDPSAHELAVWVGDLLAVVGLVRGWADEAAEARDDDTGYQQVSTELFAAWAAYLHRRERRHA